MPSVQTRQCLPSFHYFGGQLLCTALYTGLRKTGTVQPADQNLVQIWFGVDQGGRGAAVVVGQLGELGGDVVVGLLVRIVLVVGPFVAGTRGEDRRERWRVLVEGWGLGARRLSRLGPGRGAAALPPAT